ncbi:MAG: thioredoxin-disulfide reductase [Lachnospiraceae bacterium]|nr:thioredoxin-disulfide reductase [Lachnospiraceae bacterium]
MYDLIIVGSGPAGLTAAIYATRARLSFLIIERNFMSGGQVVDTYEVDNYPALPGISGMDLSMKMRDHAEKLGAEFVTAEVTKLELAEDIKKVYTEEEVYEAKTVILATGAGHRKLGIPGEKELAGMGVSYCATCDGAFFRGSDVAVIGGGDVAVEDAIFLARGCRKVYVVHRRDELRAAKVLQEKLLSLPNVEMVWNALPKSIEGENQVGALQVTDKFTGEVRILQVDGVFVAVGIVPNNALVKDQLALDAGGYIAAGENCETSIPGVYAIGDVRAKKLRQIITACGDGANAVTSVQDYLLTH